MKVFFRFVLFCFLDKGGRVTDASMFTELSDLTNNENEYKKSIVLMCFCTV